jgi:tight adherence protein B
MMSPAWFACVIAAGACVALLCRPGPRVLRWRLRAATGSAGFAARAPRPPGRAAVLLLASSGLLVLVVLWPSGVLLALSLGLVLGGASWLHRGGRRRRQAERRRRDTIEACDALTAELLAGQPVVHALHRTADQHPVLWPAARAGALGGDVPAVLRELATAPGGAGLRMLAAAWQVAEGSGAGLVATLQRVSETLRADAATGAETAASLAPARATARLLAVLPVFGLLLGAGLGGDPVGLLLGTTVGNGLLLTGTALALAGTLWVERLAGRVETV